MRHYASTIATIFSLKCTLANLCIIVNTQLPLNMHSSRGILAEVVCCFKQLCDVQINWSAGRPARCPDSYQDGLDYRRDLKICNMVIQWHTLTEFCCLLIMFSTGWPSIKTTFVNIPQRYVHIVGPSCYTYRYYYRICVYLLCHPPSTGWAD